MKLLFVFRVLFISIKVKIWKFPVENVIYIYWYEVFLCRIVLEFFNLYLDVEKILFLCTSDHFLFSSLRTKTKFDWCNEFSNLEVDACWVCVSLSLFIIYLLFQFFMPEWCQSLYDIYSLQGSLIV